MSVERARLQHPGGGPAVVVLELRAEQLVREFGRPGELQYRAETFPDPTQARRAFQTQVYRLIRRGYVPGHHNPAMIAAIRAGWDDAAYGVYADWLAERGDPRAELIQVQTRLEADPNNAALRALERRLLDEYGVHWAEPRWSEQQSFRWRRGFVDALDFAGLFGGYGWPGNQVRGDVLPYRSLPWLLLRGVLRHPSGGLLRWITETRQRPPRGRPGYRRYRVEYDARAGWRELEIRLLLDEQSRRAPAGR